MLTELVKAFFWRIRINQLIKCQKELGKRLNNQIDPISMGGTIFNA